jgi:Fic family protein
MSDKSYFNRIKIIEPDFKSPVTDLIIALDHLRKKELGGTTSPDIFFQLKEIFHFMESLGSARIEGNRTTLAELVERKIENLAPKDEQFLEIDNVEKAIHFIDENVNKTPINKIFISELHRLVVKNLSPNKEGDFSPGTYRQINVKIAKAKHIPPDYNQVPNYMEDLIEFINKNDSHKYDLLKTALAHHRFAWIHPFRNGNGRTVRLLTYAMLVKQGFRVDTGRILNPTAVFCNDRQKYYDLLASADSEQEADLLNWCEYVLSGLRSEIEKIDRLLDYKFLATKILIPAVIFARERKIITEVEGKVLAIAITEQIFQAGDLKPAFPKKVPADISRIIRRLKEKNMVVSIAENERKYYINFYNNYLLRGIIEILKQEGFLPLKDSE